MVKPDPLVSVIIIFLNAEAFLVEAVESVLAQTYTHWELLLVDDGSTDGSTVIAQGYAARFPDRIRCLEHPGHVNRGMSAARNLGIRHATGRYIAFLDADDIWLAHKLTEQIALLESHPEAAMLYGNTEYWYDWEGSGAPTDGNYQPLINIPPDVVYPPPTLLPLYLLGKAAVPCTCSIVLRREAFAQVGGFEESFRGMYEDQAFYAKVALELPIYVSGEFWDKYRQHPASACSTAEREGKARAARAVFLTWLEAYIEHRTADSANVKRALQRARWQNNHPGAAKLLRRAERVSKVFAGTK